MTHTINIQRQSGVVLILALTLLLVLTVVAVASMNTSGLEQKMTTNMRDRQIALQAAEAALREGERFVEDNTLLEASFNSTCTNGQCLCPFDDCVDYWTDTTVNVWSTAGRHKVYSGDQLGSAPALYIIEFMGHQCTPLPCSSTPANPAMYRVTALGFGQTGSRVMLQSTYLKD